MLSFTYKTFIVSMELCYMLNLHECKIASHGVVLLNSIPAPISTMLFIDLPTYVPFLFFSHTRLLMSYFYSGGLLPPFPLGCQAIDQRIWLAKDLLLDMLTVTLSLLMILFFLLTVEPESTGVHIFLYRYFVCYFFLLQCKKSFKQAIRKYKTTTSNVITLQLNHSLCN